MTHGARESHGRPRVLVISADVLGTEMAGVGIRAYELARALQPVADVTLAGIDAEPGSLPGVETVGYATDDAAALETPIARADAIVAQPHWPPLAHRLRRSGARLIFDLYDPEPLEVLEFLAGRRPLLRRLVTALTVDRILEALRSGHHFICASEKQRDLWVGTMMAERLISPSLYDRDPSLASVLAVVPFGVPGEPPADDRPGLHARFPQLRRDDQIVLWNGGIWSWLDAPTAVRAVAALASRRPGVRLVFMGASPAGPARAATEQTRRLARELGVLDSVVFFNDAWVPYAERGSWLLEADCALTTHVDHLETRFAFRTRVLDCFWAGLPVVCTRGDELAERVERDGLGATVPEADPPAVAAALEEVLDRGREHYGEGLRRAAADFEWSRVAEPLSRYVTRADLPPRLGARVLRRPSQVARNAAFRTTVRVLDGLGIRWTRRL